MKSAQAKKRRPNDSLPAWRKERSDNKRKAILTGARTVFLREGFGGASMEEVAATAGVSKMTLYRHYPTKDALFAGLINELCSRIVGDEFALDISRPIAEVLHEYAKRSISTIFAAQTIQLHRIVIAESTRFPAVGRLFYSSGPGAQIAALAAYLERLQNEKRIALEDPGRAAEAFLDLLRGYSHLRVLLGLEQRPSQKLANARAEQAAHYLLHAIEEGKRAR